MLELNINVNIEGIKELSAAILALAAGEAKTVLPVADAKEQKETKKGKAVKKSAGAMPVMVAEEGDLKAAPEAPKEEQAKEEPTGEAKEVEEVTTVDPEASKSNAATLYALSEAGANLLEAGKMNELISLLHSFNIEAVPMLKPEQYEDFAAGLRRLGAKI